MQKVLFLLLVAFVISCNQKTKPNPLDYKKDVSGKVVAQSEYGILADTSGDNTPDLELSGYSPKSSMDINLYYFKEEFLSKNESMHSKIYVSFIKPYIYGKVVSIRINPDNSYYGNHQDDGFWIDTSGDTRPDISYKDRPDKSWPNIGDSVYLIWKHKDEENFLIFYKKLNP